MLPVCLRTMTLAAMTLVAVPGVGMSAVPMTDMRPAKQRLRQQAKYAD